MSEGQSTFRAGLEQEIEPFNLSADAVQMLDADLEWITLYRQGRLAEAYAQLCCEGPLPEMTAHIRPGPDAEDNAALRQLQYMIAWIARDRGLTGVQVPADAAGFRVAVVGGGPAGLAGAVRLLEKGYDVNIVEREGTLGGMPALVYDAQRLPDPDEEIEARLAPAIQAGRCTLSLGRDMSPDSLLKGHDAVLLATGCWNEPSLGDAQGVWTALAFLKAVRNGEPVEVPPKVAVLCGGDAAMDAAVVVKRRGAQQLNLLFDGPREAIHWHLPDAWFDTEGVKPHFDVHPAGYEVDAEGRVCGVVLEGRQTLEADMVIEAMGLHPDQADLESEGVFAAGALVNGGASVQQCMQEGFAAAEEIDHYLKGVTS